MDVNGVYQIDNIIITAPPEEDSGNEADNSYNETNTHQQTLLSDDLLGNILDVYY